MSRSQLFRDRVVLCLMIAGLLALWFFLFAGGYDAPMQKTISVEVAQPGWSWWQWAAGIIGGVLTAAGGTWITVLFHRRKGEK